ncbi:hypothetical protein VTK73DRAFT_7845 [Phialemonium thermophilum]|uniref:Uncharacterized protein n=1 Tax=Phialemonium thermophilum TaxID=223376 RepID=A0ABR3WCV2_9PEZI
MVASWISSFTLGLAAFGYYVLFQNVQDVAVLAGLSVIRSRTLVRHVLERVCSLLTPARSFRDGVLALSLLSVTLSFFWATKPKQQPSWSGIGRVLLFPCTTTHSRLFPQKHAFTYSYLVVGVPVGWEGEVGGLVSAGVKGPGNKWPASWLRRAWFDIDAGDYLERGRAHLGLRGKLDEYLRTQGVDPLHYPHAYLVTAPRFLGYQFNPVSFWYLYDARRSLAALILEVNNTFDERRMYFLRRSDEKGIRQVSSAGEPTRRPESQTGPTATVRHVWPKDFHVSPFNSRKGSYSLAATDPLGPGGAGAGSAGGLISNTITLKSSKGHAKLVAQLVSDGPAVDPTNLTRMQKMRLLAAWWWVGLATFPRILKEAAVLFFCRNLHVWYRPEPLKGSMGRRADSTEQQLEKVFHRYLRYLVAECEESITVRYISCGLPENPAEVISPHGDPRDRIESSTPGSPSPHPPASAPAGELEIRVLTPAFYTRFVAYAHDLEAFHSEFRESGTLWMSHAELLPRLLLRRKTPPPTVLATSSRADFACFRAIQRLRRRPPRIERPRTSSGRDAEERRKMAAAATEAVDVRGFRISPMDSFVLSSEDGEMRRMYRGTVLKLFLADRLLFGSVFLLETFRFSVQAWTAWYLAGGISQMLLLAVQRL